MATSIEELFAKYEAGVRDFSGSYLCGVDLKATNLRGVNLSGANLRQVELKYADLTGANLSDANLSDGWLEGINLIEADLSGANLRRIDLSSANLIEADLSGTDLRDANLIKAYLSGANLKNANLTDAELCHANLSGANLSGADLSGVNLSGADLSGVNLNGTIGLAPKEKEMAEAQRILDILTSGQGQLDMRTWHDDDCNTIHCLAGWIFPDIKLPGGPASRKCPTLAKYFYHYDVCYPDSNKGQQMKTEVMEALKRVAEGTESIYNS